MTSAVKFQTCNTINTNTYIKCTHIKIEKKYISSTPKIEHH